MPQKPYPQSKPVPKSQPLCYYCNILGLHSGVQLQFFCWLFHCLIGLEVGQHVRYFPTADLATLHFHGLCTADVIFKNRSHETQLSILYDNCDELTVTS